MSSPKRQITLLIWVGVIALTLLATADTVYALPPRPEPESRKPVKGGGIELHVDAFVPDAAARVTAVVQWQDGLGEWHDVDGWRGELEEERVIWWVSPDHFGAGPFRWLIYRGSDDEVLATSVSFDLPEGHGHLVRVSVSLAE